MPTFGIVPSGSNTQKSVTHRKRHIVYPVLLILILGIPYLGGAEVRDPALENKIHRQLEAIAPEAVNYFKVATQTMDAGDYGRARENYKKVLEYAPDFVPALRRLSYVVDNAEETLRLAQRAYALDKHYYNISAVVNALIKQKQVNASEILAYVQRLNREAPHEVHAQTMICEAALRIQKTDLLRKAVANLKESAPENAATHYYAGIEAAIDSRWREAEREIVRARELGLPEAAAENLLDKNGIRSHANRQRWLIYASIGFVVWATGLVLLLISGLLLSRATLLAIEKGRCEERLDIKNGIFLIRKIYALVLGLTSAYFYISIPVVIGLVIATGGGVIYAFLLFGILPIKFSVLIILVVCLTIFVMLKSLFIHAMAQDPGPRLNEDEAPSFFNALREVAAKISAPMVDSVFIVRDATIAVFERGSFWKRLAGRTEKCLILGLGLLDGMTQLQLKSILAHEFGHISNRDTAGGSVALHVRRSIVASANAMAEGGLTHWYNPAWLFITGYYRIFLRVSQGASRLQEVLADKWAVMAYGVRGFILGLQHAILRSIEFELISELEINRAIRERRHLNNLYLLKVPELWPEPNSAPPDEESEEVTENNLVDLPPRESVETAFEEAMREQTSPFDSHPAPQQRIKWIEALRNPADVEDDGRPAWELLDNAAALQELMTSKINARVQQFIESNVE